MSAGPPETGFAVIPAGSAHAEVFAALHGACFARPWRTHAFHKLLSVPANFGFLASPSPLPENAPVGFVLVQAAAGVADIVTLGVTPDHRRLGVATLLLETGCRASADRGCTEIFLEVEADNSAALALYHARGFLEAGRRRRYYRRHDGDMDALILRRGLCGAAG